MASLSSCQGCSPAEGLHPSQGESSVSVHRASRMRGVGVCGIQMLGGPGEARERCV